MDGDSRILYLPLETRVRELDARLYFALTAVQANFQVVLGPRWLLQENIDRLPRGIFTFKTVNRIDARTMETVKAHGHTVVAWDEEGPGQIIPDVYLRSIDDHAIEQAEKVFAWGGHQAKALSGKYPQAKGKIETAGNPRWDILRQSHAGYFTAEAQALRAKIGRFLLLNTNFSTYNSCFKDGLEEIRKLGEAVGAVKTDADRQLLQDIHDFEGDRCQSYVDLLPGLSAAFPDHVIVVRPHPTEYHPRWAASAAAFPNVRCIHEGTVQPWILAAEAVIQNSCTTGVEALTLGRPVASYCRTALPGDEAHLANAVCPRIYGEAALIDFLRRVVVDPAAFAPYRAEGMKILATHIARLSGESSSAAIVKMLGFLANRREKQGARFDRVFHMPGGLRPFEMTPYLALKLPPISLQDMGAMAGRMAVIEPRFWNTKIVTLADSCFFLGRQG